jgi:hypothetical protein
LATLLIAAIKGLEGGALMDSPSPDGPPENAWLDFLQYRAKHKLTFGPTTSTPYGKDYWIAAGLRALAFQQEPASQHCLS